MEAEARIVVFGIRGPAAPAPPRPGGDLSDLELVARWRDERRRDAFEALVRRHQRGLYSFVLRFVKDQDDAADLAQRTFVRAMGAIDGFEARSEFRTWLFRIAVNLCKNHHRDRGRRGEVELEPERMEATEADGAAVGPGGLISREELAAVRAAVDALPPKQQLTLNLRVYQDMSFKEVASVMGCREGTAKVNFHHAVTRLRKALAALGGGAGGAGEK
jgi:RNA polymerase sigma-70 factor (ECF subfamily)